MVCTLACAVLTAAACAGEASHTSVSETPMVAPAPAHVSVTPDVSTGAKLPAPAPRRVAHGGGGALAPENTLAAFRSGLAHGADGLELDVHLSLDGRLVVIHDPTVDRTTNGSGTVADLSVAQLKALDAGARFEGPSAGPQEIPALLEVLDLLSAPGNERVGLQVEIKLRADGSRYPGIEAALVSMLRARSFVERTTAISFDFPTLRTIARLEPGLRTCALVGKDYFKSAAATPPDQIARSLAALGVTSVGVREQNLAPGLYEALRRAGLGVGAWTVDDPGRMRSLTALGVDFITSNRPDLLRLVFP